MVEVVFSAQGGKPNVILIMTDDQGYGDMSAHGDPVLKTPEMDKLHASSVRFTDFHVAPKCTPTRGQLLTGIDAMRNGATRVCQGRSMVRREFKMMPQYFIEAGYATGMFGKWHLGDSYPHRPRFRGFQEVLSFRAWGITSLAVSLVKIRDARLCIGSHGIFQNGRAGMLRSWWLITTVADGAISWSIRYFFRTSRQNNGFQGLEERKGDYETICFIDSPPVGNPLRWNIFSRGCDEAEYTVHCH